MTRLQQVSERLRDHGLRLARAYPSPKRSIAARFLWMTNGDRSQHAADIECPLAQLVSRSHDAPPRRRVGGGVGSRIRLRPGRFRRRLRRRLLFGWSRSVSHINLQAGCRRPRHGLRDRRAAVRNRLPGALPRAQWSGASSNRAGFVGGPSVRYPRYHGTVGNERFKRSCLEYTECASLKTASCSATVQFVVRTLRCSAAQWLHGSG